MTFCNRWRQLQKTTTDQNAVYTSTTQAPHMSSGSLYKRQWKDSMIHKKRKVDVKSCFLEM